VCRVKELTPKPRNHTRKRSLCAEKEGESRRDEIWREEDEDHWRKLESAAALEKSPVGVWGSCLASTGGRNEKLASRLRGLGLYAPAVGAPNALKGPPDASSAHRTKTQRGFQNARSPDNGHRTLD